MLVTALGKDALKMQKRNVKMTATRQKHGHEYMQVFKTAHREQKSNVFMHK